MSPAQYLPAMANDSTTRTIFCIEICVACIMNDVVFTRVKFLKQCVPCGAFPLDFMQAHRTIGCNELLETIRFLFRALKI